MMMSLAGQGDQMSLLKQYIFKYKNTQHFGLLWYFSKNQLEENNHPKGKNLHNLVTLSHMFLGESHPILVNLIFGLPVMFLLVMLTFLNAGPYILLAALVGRGIRNKAVGRVLLHRFVFLPGLPDLSWYNLPKTGKYTK
jgi:hypothetical protein